MKRLLSLTLALLMAATLLGISGAKTYAHAEGETPAPTAEPEAKAAAEGEAEIPTNTYLGLWEITGRQDGEDHTSYADEGMKAYLDFLPNGAIYAVLYDGEHASDDYLAYVVTGENTLDLYEGEDAIPGVYDPETAVITVTEPTTGLITFVERVKEDPLPDIRALVDHSQEEQTWYGYEMRQSGQTVNLLEVLPTMSMDPRDFYLTLAPDGTGYLQFGDEEAGGEITWTADQITPKENPDEPVTYTRAGDHILFEVEGMTVEFAPEGEVEALLATMENDQPEKVEVEVDAEDLVGEWKLAKATAAGQTLSAEELKEKGQDLSFRFDADGSASMTSDGKTTDGLSWTLEGNVLSLTMYSYDLFKLRFDGTYLVLSMGADLYFEKIG